MNKTIIFLHQILAINNFINIAVNTKDQRLSPDNPRQFPNFAICKYIPTVQIEFQNESFYIITMVNKKFVLLKLALIAVLTTAKPNCYSCQYPNGNGLYFNQPQMQLPMAAPQPILMQYPLAMPQSMMHSQPMPVSQPGPQPLSFSQSAPMTHHAPIPLPIGIPHQPQVSQRMLAQRPVSVAFPQMQHIPVSEPLAHHPNKNSQISYLSLPNTNAFPGPYPVQRQQHFLPNYPINFPGGGFNSGVGCVHNK